MNSANKGTIWTLLDFINEYSQEDIRIDAFYLKQVFYDEGMPRKLVVNSDNVVDKYMKELESTKKVIELSTEEYYKYRYNPKKLSFDIYGTTELWFLILMANEIYSISEFNYKKLHLYDTSFTTKLNRILEIDNELLELNSMEVKQAIESKES